MFLFELCLQPKLHVFIISLNDRCLANYMEYIYKYEKYVRTEIVLILCMIKDLRQMSKCTFHHKYTIKEDAELLDLLHPFKKEGSYEERRKI